MDVPVRSDNDDNDKDAFVLKVSDDTDAAAVVATETDTGGGVYVRSAVHGALDGIVTTFTTICAAYGVNISVPVMVQMGTANVIGDALSIALSDAVSTGVALRSARSHIGRIRKRVLSDRQRVVNELAVELLAPPTTTIIGTSVADVGSGIDSDELRRTLNALPVRALVLMKSALEVDSASPADKRSDSWIVLSRQALVTAAAFIASGVIPIATLWIGSAVTNNDTGGFVCSLLTTFALLCALGAINARLASMPALKSIGLLMGTTIPTVALVYGISYGITAALPEELRDAETCNLIHYFVRAAPR